MITGYSREEKMVFSKALNTTIKIECSNQAYQLREQPLETDYKVRSSVSIGGVGGAKLN